MAKQSPPRPVLVGSVTPSTAAMATHASAALPPAFSMSRPTWDAWVWEEEVAPWVHITGERREVKWRL